jgi:hypothetical protein
MFTATFQKMGFFKFFENKYAEQLSVSQKIGGRSAGRLRTYDIRQTRTFICAQMKRNDAVSRRFIQYITMFSSEVLILVRDAKTGRIVTKPTKDQMWLIRRKAGTGRLSKSDWQIIKEVDTEFFESMDRHRRWRFGFEEYYDIYVWDLEPGRNSVDMYRIIKEVSTPIFDYRLFLSCANSFSESLSSAKNHRCQRYVASSGTHSQKHYS